VHPLSSGGCAEDSPQLQASGVDSKTEAPIARNHRRKRFLLRFDRPPRRMILSRGRRATVSSTPQQLGVEPFHSKDRKQDKCCHDDKLRDQEWGLGLGWSQCFQGRHLLEELHDQHENIEIERHHGPDRVDRTPSTNEVKDVAG
jgi:hypothetical protein